MIFYDKTILLLYLLILTMNYSMSMDVNEEGTNTLEKLVKLFSEPGAFKRVNEILGENTIEGSSPSCPTGDDGLDCRRNEARRSADCPTGDCYCYNCAVAGPELWAPCCRESSKCCSHLAAACRNCDHPTLFPFCSKHFKKCLSESNQNVSSTENILQA